METSRLKAFKPTFAIVTVFPIHNRVSMGSVMATSPMVLMNVGRKFVMTGAPVPPHTVEAVTDGVGVRVDV